MEDYLNELTMILLTIRIQCELKKTCLRTQIFPEEQSVTIKQFEELLTYKKDEEQMLRIHPKSINLLCEFLKCIQSPASPTPEGKKVPEAKQKYSLETFWNIYEKKITVHKAKYLKMSHLQFILTMNDSLHEYIFGDAMLKCGSVKQVIK